MRLGSLAVMLAVCGCASSEKHARPPKPPRADVEACEHVRALAVHWMEKHPGASVKGDVARFCTNNLAYVYDKPPMHDCRARCSIAIAPDGSVRSATAAKTSASAELSECIARVFLAQRFVPPDAGDPTTFTIPVVLSATK